MPEKILPASGVTVIMPTYNQANFISRALKSLLEQTFQRWELLIINDASTDNTGQVIESFCSDERILCSTNVENKGLGACLNIGLAGASYDLIAYLPSDDVYYKDHLSSLVERINEEKSCALVYSGVRHHYNRYATGRIDNYALQLVQVLHKRNEARWIERNELVTDDLDRMFWHKLTMYGKFAGTGKISCEWVDHPHQRHKIIQEPVGGINPYKQRYHVNQPLRYHSTMGNYIDEISYYQPFRNRKYIPQSTDRLKIVLAGELAYNPERILALEEQGHKLYGLWMRDPYWYNFVGPLPFGNVEDIPLNDWEDRLKEIKPDIIYALLNWQAVPFAREVMLKAKEIPFVWHFKEGPFICLEKGTWTELIELHTRSDGQIYSSPEMLDWFKQFLSSNGNAHILDGDLPKRDWFKDERTSLISDLDGEIHTVVPGRPIGLHPYTVEELAANKIHLHFYGDFTHGQWKEWIRKTLTLAPGYLHIHANCSQDQWVKEFSQYDAGWLHFFASENYGEIMRANWDDLNYPARMATFACAGLPMLQRDNSGHIVATQNIVREHDLGLFFNDIHDLSRQLKDKRKMQALRNNVWKKRTLFSFDDHVSDLIAFFRQTILKKQDRTESYPPLKANA